VSLWSRQPFDPRLAPLSAKRRLHLTASRHRLYLTDRLSIMIDETDDLSLVFDALANEHRRGIIGLLALQPRSISQLAEVRGLSLPAMHKHVRVLEGAAMVRRRKIGRTNFLALERKPLRDLQTWMEQFHPWWGTDEESLENYAEYLSNDPTTTKE
jgi:DNA-binding transcriptional ArsR family regulator